MLLFEPGGIRLLEHVPPYLFFLFNCLRGVIPREFRIVGAVVWFRDPGEKSGSFGGGIDSGDFLGCGNW